MMSIGRAEENLVGDAIGVEMAEAAIENDNDGTEEKVEVILGLPDLLYEENDTENYGEKFEQMEFRRWAARFLAEELQASLNHHQLALLKTKQRDEEPVEVLQKALRLADQMQREGRWPTEIGVRAVLRLALRKVLFFGYAKNFELDGVPKNRVSRQYPSNAEQLERFRKLETARMAVRENPQMKQALVDLTNRSLKMQMLPEMFMRSASNDVTAEQQNDLAVNFLLWTMERNTAFAEKHRVVVFLSLFKGADRKQVVDDYMRAAGAPKEERAKAEAEVNDAYEQTADFFKEHGAEMLEEFLSRARLNGKDRLSSPVQQIEKTKRDGVSSYFREVSKVTYPTNYWEVLLRSSEVVMAKRGNLSARNKFMEVILKLIVSLSKKKIDKSDSMQENIAHSNLEILEKIISYDPRFGYTPSTYFTFWIKQTVDRRVKEDRNIRIPIHFMEAMGRYKLLQRNYPNLSAEELDELFLENGSEKVLQRIKDQSYGATVASLDAPLMGKDGESETTFGDLQADESDLGKIMELTADKEVAEKLGLILDMLPPMQGIVLRLRVGLYPGSDGKGLTLAQIGALYHVSRERVRQIENKIKDKLRDSAGPGKYYRVKNAEHWKNFCELKGWGKVEIDVMNMSLGWDKATYYRECSTEQIGEELRKRHGVSLTKEKIAGMWRKINYVIFGDGISGKSALWLLEEVPERVGYSLARQFIKQLSAKEQKNEMNWRVKEFFDSKPKGLDVDWTAMVEKVKDVVSPKSHFDEEDEEIVGEDKAEEAEEVLAAPKKSGYKKRIKEITKVNISEEDIERIIVMEGEVGMVRSKTAPLQMPERSEKPVYVLPIAIQPKPVKAARQPKKPRGNGMQHGPSRYKIENGARVEGRNVGAEVEKIAVVESSVSEAPVVVVEKVVETRSDLAMVIEKIFSGDIQRVAVKILMEKKKIPQVVEETGLPANKVMMLSTMARIRMNDVAPELLVEA